MTGDIIPTCGEHQISKAWKQTTFEYKDDGISVRVPCIYAWVCPVDGEASFTAETVDKLITTVRELIESAKRAKKETVNTCSIQVKLRRLSQ